MHMWQLQARKVQIKLGLSLNTLHIVLGTILSRCESPQRSNSWLSNILQEFYVLYKFNGTLIVIIMHGNLTYI